MGTQKLKLIQQSIVADLMDLPAVLKAIGNQTNLQVAFQVGEEVEAELALLEGGDEVGGAHVFPARLPRARVVHLLYALRRRGST